MKSEPSAYSIDDLKKDGKTPWSGVRNYQARNFMRDDMKVGDTVFFYHSNTKDIGIIGIGEVCSLPYPDKTAFDENDEHFDPKSKKESPTWVLVDICFVKKCAHTMSLEMIKSDSHLKDIAVARRGNRLSVMPVSKEHAEYILKKIS